LSWGYQFLLGLALNAALLVWCLRDERGSARSSECSPASPVYPNRTSLVERLNG
jgi:hypothetical protein